MVVGRKNGNIAEFVTGNYIFQTVNNFKYLDININIPNNMHKEIKLRILAANKNVMH